MNDFSSLLTQGNAWMFAPSAIFLGALHGLEPGHSKTMMAAFIVAIRGTVMQAVLLGVSATLSHTAVVWVVAMAGLYFGRDWAGEGVEAYLQVVSAIIVVAVALWMIWRTRRNEHACFHDHGDHHGHDHDEAKLVDTGHGVLRLAIQEDVPTAPRFALGWQGHHAHALRPHEIRLEITRPDGRQESFTFDQVNRELLSQQVLVEPHEFVARVKLMHGHHSHDFDVEFVEPSGTHHHHHADPAYDSLDAVAPGYQDPHELAHANDIKKRFANREVTTPQIVMFGLTGGLIPCPASIAVLLLCLQVKRIALGASLVMCFSIGLALTMVASGVLAALSVRHVSKRWSGFGSLSQKAPYLSGLVMLLVGCYMGYQGWHGLVATHSSI